MGLQDFPPSSTMGESRFSHERTPLITDPTRIESSRPLHEGKGTWHLICLVLSVLLERTAYYGILANLVLFLNDGLQVRQDITIVCLFLFTGMAWMMSTIGGLIGDSYLGRYHTIWSSLCLYIIGAILLDVLAFGCKDAKSLNCQWAIALSCLLLSIGEGVFKANSSAFGAEQLQKHTSDTYTRFFNWFYWAINIGSFTGYSLIAYVQVRYSFKIGFMIPAGCLVAALVIFLIPTAQYSIYPLAGNALKKVFGVIKEAYSLRKSNRRSDCPGLEEVMPISSWLDRAMCKYGGSYLDSEVMEVKTLGKISVLFVMLIPYWMVYYQMNSTFLLQGLHMSLEFNSTKPFDVPAAWLTLVDVTVVLIMIPLMDKVIYPCLEKRGCQMTPNKRISIGFLFAIASMFTAGIVEMERIKSIYHNPPRMVNQTINNKTYEAADMTIFYQVPQYGLIGISEVFASVGCLEFAYREAPESMHGFVMGLFYLVGSVGNLIGAGLYLLNTRAFNLVKWIRDPGDADMGHLDFYFYQLGAILFVTWLIFLVVSVRYNYKSDKGSSQTRTPRTVTRTLSDSNTQHTL